MLGLGRVLSCLFDLPQQRSFLRIGEAIEIFHGFLERLFDVGVVSFLDLVPRRVDGALGGVHVASQRGGIAEGKNDHQRCSSSAQASSHGKVSCRSDLLRAAQGLSESSVPAFQNRGLSPLGSLAAARAPRPDSARTRQGAALDPPKGFALWTPTKGLRPLDTYQRASPSGHLPKGFALWTPTKGLRPLVQRSWRARLLRPGDASPGPL